MGGEGHQRLWEEPHRRGRASQAKGILDRIVQESSVLIVVFLLIKLYPRTAWKCLRGREESSLEKS